MSSSPSFLDPIVLPLIVGESVLDVACGYGRWGNLIYANFWEAKLSAPPQVDGFDAFAPNVELCQGHRCYRRVWEHILPRPIEGRWDTVLACEIIEHLPQSDIDRAFAVLEGAAKRRIIISTPNWPYYRGGGETIVGYNEYEAHLSYVSRAEFRRRGYKVIGAGFGNPTNRLTGAILRRSRRMAEAFQSLSRALPSIGFLVVAYKDV